MTQPELKMNRRRAAFCSTRMMRLTFFRIDRRRLLALAAFTALHFASQGAQAQSAALLGIYGGAGCTGVQAHESFANFLGRRPQHALEFMTWASLNENSAWSMNCWKSGGIESITYSVPMLPADGSATLADGAAGRFDDVFRAFANRLVERGYPNAIVRIGWEFNGEWYAWAASKDPQNWIAYWRRIVTVMRGVPGAQFKFDWCPGNGWTNFLAENAYPGDAYVDIIGLDAYNQSWNPNVTTPEQRWNEQVNQRHGLKWHANFAAAHGKPMSFPEWGTGRRSDGHGAGDDPLFIEQMAEWIATHNIAYHNYWDYSEPIYSSKISDGSQPQAAAAYVKKFKLPQPKAPRLDSVR